MLAYWPTQYNKQLVTVQALKRHVKNIMIKYLKFFRKIWLIILVVIIINHANNDNVNTLPKYSYKLLQ